MTGLAEFVMRGRSQALMVVLAGVVSSLFCWISAAVIGLVTLRKGLADGLWLYMWAMLPAVLLVYLFGDTAPLTLVTGTLILALVLRASVSLALAVLAAVGVGLLTGAIALLFGAAYLEQMVELLANLMASLQPPASEGQAVELAAPGIGLVAGMLGAGTAVISVLSLLLARYWQAALYNPGGFGSEFRALRYPITATIAMLSVGLALGLAGSNLGSWAMICVVPLMFAGLALVHSWAQHHGRGTGWLAGFYVIWLLFEPVKLVTVGLAVADAWFDFRQRWSGGAGKDSEAGLENTPDRRLDDKEDQPGDESAGAKRRAGQDDESDDQKRD